MKPAPKDVVGAGSWIARDAGKAAVSVIWTKNAFWVMSANVKLTRRHISWSEAGGLKKAFKELEQLTKWKYRLCNVPMHCQVLAWQLMFEKSNCMGLHAASLVSSSCLET